MVGRSQEGARERFDTRVLVRDSQEGASERFDTRVIVRDSTVGIPMIGIP